MNRIRLISLLCFLLICPLAAPAQVRIISREKLDSVSNPKLAPNSNALEFDKLHITAEPMTEDDSPESFIYTFRNKSQSSLTISLIVSTCSCVQATCDRKEVAPGEYATVKANKQYAQTEFPQSRLMPRPAVPLPVRRSAAAW